MSHAHELEYGRYNNLLIPILDNSAVALLKNSSLKNIKIIFYNKSGKLSKDFAKEAEQYILDKGVKKDQFIIEIR